MVLLKNRTTFALLLALSLGSLGFGSCATFPTAGVLPPDSVEVYATVPEQILPAWTALGPGLYFLAARVEDPALRLRAVRVDLLNPAICIVVGPPGPGDGTTTSIKTSSFARDYDCAVAINTLPFEPVSTVEGEPRRLAGITVSAGKRIAPPDPRYAALVFLADGSAAVREQATLGTDQEPWHAAGGFFTVLAGGLPLGNDRYRNPRSAAGVSADGHTLYLLVIDGRRRASVGATALETGRILARLGATDGLLFDGGGSSALALRSADGSVRLANVPVHSRLGDGERAVAGCLGVRY